VGPVPLCAARIEDCRLDQMGEDRGVSPTRCCGKFDTYKRGGCAPMALPTYEQAQKIEPEETRDACTFSASD